MSLLGAIKDAVTGDDPKRTQPKEPNELTGVAPDGDGKVTNRPTPPPATPAPPD